MKKKAVIFDMDGVLLDTAQFNIRSFNELLQPYDLDIDSLGDKHGESFRGASVAHILKAVKEERAVEFTPEDFSKKAGEIAFRMMDEEGVIGDTALRPLLEELKKAGFLLGIGTSSLKWRVQPILERLGVQDFFKVIVSAEDVTEHKPDPSVFLQVAEKLNVEPKNCVVIEDARSGIEAAHNGGMKAIALTAYNQDPLLAEEADFVAKDFSTISVKVIESLISDEQATNDDPE